MPASRRSTALRATSSRTGNSPAVTTHELIAEGATLGELLSAAATAVGDLVALDNEGVPDRVPILVESNDLDSLVPDFLDDLLYLSEIEHFAVAQVERLDLDGSYLRAAVSGWTGPTRKVGYDEVSLERPHGTWQLHLVVSDR
jgi:SHS2 domain-containing protein